MIIDSGSIDTENKERLGVLYEKHNSWLMACAYNASNDVRISEDLVQELYLYLLEKRNPKLFYNDSFNLLYCHNFINSRYINYIKRENRTTYITDSFDREETPYNEEWDKKLEDSYNKIKEELQRLSKTRMWSSAKLYEMYAFTDTTMEELSKNIGISKSTTFLNIKKIKQHLKDMIDNPFNDEPNE